MATKGTVRLQVFSEITGRGREAIRNQQKNDDAPWYESDFAAGKHREFNTYHALALRIAESLMIQGLSVAEAGEVVRTHDTTINKFLDEIEAGAQITPRTVVAIKNAYHDDWTGPRWEMTVLLGTGTTQEVIGTIQDELVRAGTVRQTRDGRSTKRHIGGPFVAMQHVPSAYWMLQQKAAQVGYRIEGRSILPDVAPKVSPEASK